MKTRSFAGVVALGLVATPPIGCAVAADTFRQVTIGASTSLYDPGRVGPADFTLVPPVQLTDAAQTRPDASHLQIRRPITAPLFGYGHQWYGYVDTTERVAGADRLERHPYGRASKNPSDVEKGDYVIQTPLLSAYSRDLPEWWDEVLDEYLYTRAPLILMSTRGCYHPDNPDDLTGAGNFCPHVVAKMLQPALRRSGATGLVRFSTLVDAPAIAVMQRDLYAQAKIPYPQVTVDGARLPDAFDLTPGKADRLGHTPLWYFWDAAIKPMLDAIPKDQWYFYNDKGTLKPVVAFWTIANSYDSKGNPHGNTMFYKNTEGNISALLTAIKAKFEAPPPLGYGMTPFFNIIDMSSADTSLKTAHDLVGSLDGWFNINKNLAYSQVSWNNLSWGCVTPSFDVASRPDLTNAPVVKARGGQTLIEGFEANRTSVMTMVEGLADPVEGNFAGRSDDTRDPDIAAPYANRSLDIVRDYSDPETATTKFQAEAADSYVDAKGHPVAAKDGVDFRFGKNWGVVKLGAADQNSGWALGSTRSGESVQYDHVYLANGFYKFTARTAASGPDGRLHFSIDGVALPVQHVPDTGGRNAFAVMPLGQTFVPAGHHDLKLTFDSDGVDLDWFFARKLAPGDGGMSQRPLPTDSIGAASGATFTKVASLVPANLGGNIDVSILAPRIDGSLHDGDTIQMIIHGDHLEEAMGPNNQVLISATKTVASPASFFVINHVGANPNSGGLIESGDMVRLTSPHGTPLELFTTRSYGIMSANAASASACATAGGCRTGFPITFTSPALVATTRDAP